MRACVYARYSTEGQREASLDDQFRECERVAKQHGFEVVVRFSDAALSGGTAIRPGYQEMLTAARHDKFDVIVVEDISRLWRNRAEFGPRSAELEDLGVHMVTAVGDDTRRDGWALVIQIKQAMAEHYRRESSYRSRRGVAGRALAKASTGGRSYGYRSAADNGTEQRSVDPEQAEVVRRIFRLYADGMSARAIADQLNRDRVPSPGATWNRTKRRGAGWLASAIAGDARRGLGILNNPLYVGEVIWNRFRWQRSASDSSKRRRIENPRDQWITHTDERLRIVPQELWDAVRRRQRAQAEVIGERVKRGLSRVSAKSTGRPNRHLLSGLLRCSECGSSMVISNGAYACSSRVNGGRSACGNDVRLQRSFIEPALIDDLKTSLRDPSVFAEVQRRLRERLKNRPKHVVTEAQVRKAEQTVANLIEAISQGGFRRSAGLAERLRQAEDELARLQGEIARPGQSPKVEQLTAGVRDRWSRLVADMERMTHDIKDPRTREEVRALLGRFKVEADAREVRIYNEQGRLEAALVRTSGADVRNYGSGGVHWELRMRIPRDRRRYPRLWVAK